MIITVFLNGISKEYVSCLFFFNISLNYYKYTLIYLLDTCPHNLNYDSNYKVIGALNIYAMLTCLVICVYVGPQKLASMIPS